jgi:tetratricopeptide (TPR) repeat protein
LPKIKLPNYKEKQKVLYKDNAPPAALVAYGDKCLEGGRISDAVDFFQKANYIEGIEKIRDIVIIEGDVMEYQHTLNALGKRDASCKEWNRIGERALELKKYTFAIHAFEKSEDSSMVEKVKKLILEGNRQTE